jgi:hypothetical protein
MATRMQQRRGLAAQWNAANPVLAAGEIGFETDTNKFKMGNGTSTWSSLVYFANAQDLVAAIDSIVGLAPEALDTLAEIADAIGADGEDFLSGLATNARVDNIVLSGVAQNQLVANEASAALNSHASNTTGVHGIENTAQLATLTNVANAKSEAISEANQSAETRVSNAVAGLTKSSVGLGNVDNTADADKPVSSLQSDAIGTARTDAVTEALGETDNKITDHASVQTNVHGITDAANLVYVADLEDAVSAHNDLTLNVHGIANTADLALKSEVAAVTKATIGLASVDNTADDSKPVSTAQALAIDTAKTEAITDAGAAADTKISDHNLETQNVHGIADTSELVTQTDLSTAIIGVTIDMSGFAGQGLEWNSVNEQFDVDDTIATEAYADGAVSDHNLETENVHGISDTEQLAYKNAENQTFTGNLEVEGNIVVEGNLTISGSTTTVNAVDLSIQDPLIYLASNQYTEDVLDVGFLAATGAPGGTEADHLHSGFFRDASDSKKWKLISNVPHPVGNVVDVTNATRETLVVGALEATTVNASSGIVFSDGTQTKLGVPSVTTFAPEITSSATLAAGEADKFVPLNGAVTITLPATGYSAGQSIDFYQATGTGAQFSDANGVVGTPGRKFRTTNSVVTAMKTATGWLIFGDLAL